MPCDVEQTKRRTTDFSSDEVVLDGALYFPMGNRLPNRTFPLSILGPRPGRALCVGEISAAVIGPGSLHVKSEQANGSCYCCMYSTSQIWCSGTCPLRSDFAPRLVQSRTRTEFRAIRILARCCVMLRSECCVLHSAPVWIIMQLQC